MGPRDSPERNEGICLSQCLSSHFDGKLLLGGWYWIPHSCLTEGRSLGMTSKWTLMWCQPLRLESDLREEPRPVQSCLEKWAFGEGGRRMRWMGVGEAFICIGNVLFFNKRTWSKYRKMFRLVKAERCELGCYNSLCLFLHVWCISFENNKRAEQSKKQ